jgi:ABC-2 type transport system ATP-binding protein
MTHAIEIRDLHYRPGRGFALRDLTVTVPTGSVYGFLGPNGAGKTTTMKLVTGLLRPRSGSLRVLGRDVPRRAAQVLADVGYVPEAPHLYQSLRVGEAIRYHAAFYPRWDAALADDLGRRLDFPHDRKLSALSKGEMRKLMLLLALAHRPPLLVLDEPTDGLDPVTRRELLDVLLETVRRGDTTVFLSSHLVHELEPFCDWIAVLDKGTLVAESRTAELRDAVKRLRVDGAAPPSEGAPFTVMRRSPAGPHGETWMVRGWQDRMSGFFLTGGARVAAVEDVDLEDAFVELLRWARRTS